MELRRLFLIRTVLIEIFRSVLDLLESETVEARVAPVERPPRARRLGDQRRALSHRMVVLQQIGMDFHHVPNSRSDFVIDSSSVNPSNSNCAAFYIGYRGDQHMLLLVEERLRT
jgi:hypothetical protein